MIELVKDTQCAAIPQEQVDRNELIEALIGKSKYHLDNFKKYEIESTKPKFNGAALLFSGYWLLFKGMFLYGFAFLTVVICLAFIIPDPYYRVLGYSLQLVAGIWGNKIYYKFIQKKVQKVIDLHFEQEERLSVIKKKRKINLIAGVLLFIVFSAVSIWGTFYSEKVDGVESYYDQFVEFQIDEHQNIVNAGFLRLVNEEHVLSTDESVKLIVEVLIPNQKKMIESCNMMEIESPKLENIHGIFSEAQRDILDAFYLLRDGFLENDQAKVEEAYMNLEKVDELFQLFNKELNAYLEME